MGKAKTMTVVLSWPLSCLLCLAIGWLAHQWSTRVIVREDPGMKAVPLRLPPAKFVAISADTSEKGYQVNVFRDAPDADSISSLKVWSGGRGKVSVSFHKTNGRVNKVMICDGPAEIRDMCFREDGTLEYRTAYRYDHESTSANGLREHFDAKGMLTRKEGLTRIMKNRW